MTFQLGPHTPSMGGNSWVAPGAMVIGNVALGEDVSIWFNAVLRGDNALITVGDGSNIQDGAVLHVDPDVPLNVGRRVTVGHQAMLHGCSIGDGSLIGIHAVVLNHAVIGKNCLIGANALITEGTVVPDNSLVLGLPGKVVKTLDADAIAGMDAGTQSYIDKITRYRDELTPVGD